MATVLICPDERPAVAHLSRGEPLATMPFLGQGLLEYWLADLAAKGITAATVVAHDGKGRIAAVAGDGRRWGMKLEVTETPRELTPAQALLKYGDKLNSALEVIVLDRLPRPGAQSLFGSYGDLYKGLAEHIHQTITPERVGVRELSPGVFVGIGAYIDPQAKIEPPCWLGNHVYIGAQAHIGPYTIVEAGGFIEPRAEVSRSHIGPDTFVGRYAQIDSSLAWGATLVNWENGSVTQVPDPFLLCALRNPARISSDRWLARVGDLYTRNKAEIIVAFKHFLMRKES